MRALIIAKPGAISEKLLGAIISRIEEAGLRIEGIKMVLLDTHDLGRKILKEKNPKNAESLKEALKVPSVFLAVHGKNSLSVCEKLKDEFGGMLHTSSNEEVAKYELARFFKDEELFEYGENDFRKIIGKDSEPKLWRKYKNKSVEEIGDESANAKTKALKK